MSFATAFTLIVAAIFLIALIYIRRRSYCPKCGGELHKSGSWFICEKCRKAFKFPFFRSRIEL